MDIFSILITNAIELTVALVIAERLLVDTTRIVHRYNTDLSGVRKIAYIGIVILLLIPLAMELYPNPTFVYDINIVRVLAIGYLVYRIFNKVISNITSGLVRLAGEKFYSNVFVPLRKLGNATFLVLIFLAAINASGINLSPLLVGWGFALFMFALAIQGILGDIVAGLYILLTRPFGIGDVIQFPGGEVYEILDIKDQRTILRDIVNRETVNYSNLDLLKLKLTRFDGRAGSVVVPVPVKTSKVGELEKAKGILSQLVTELPQSSTRSDPKVYLMETSEPTAKFEVMLELEDLGRKREALDWFNTNLLKRFGAEGLQLGT